ncbi:type III polyketide synthase [Fredinandcohnia humi]
MPRILSIGVHNPPIKMSQTKTSEFSRELFQDKYKDFDRLVKVFSNGEIEERYFSENLDWYAKEHSFEEKNNTYISKAIEYGTQAITNCLQNEFFLSQTIECTEIDAFFFISTTGIATPSIEARIMNKLNFSPHTKRIPIWGLGCAGGAAGLARAFEYCKAYPKAKVIVLAVELCSLTFQKNDISKSNLIGTSLFADGTACICIVGDRVEYQAYTNLDTLPVFIDAYSTLMKGSEDVMGWEVKNNGLYVIFSKDIPSIVRNWLKGNVEEFLQLHNINISDIKHFIAHPGGKKVLDAYEDSLGLSQEMNDISRGILTKFGNMSSVTVLYVLKSYIEKKLANDGEYGLMTALGPGFSSELILLQWRK